MLIKGKVLHQVECNLEAHFFFLAPATSIFNSKLCEVEGLAGEQDINGRNYHLGAQWKKIGRFLRLFSNAMPVTTR